MNKRKYVPNLPSLQATCEHNYVHLMRLMPDCDTQSLTYEFAAGKGLNYRLTILETARYTSIVSVEQVCKSSPTYLRPAMTVRLYHDARMAEVTSSQNAGALAPSYEYPNSKMRLRNEKHMVNVFLAEWLHFCLKNRAPSEAKA